MSQVVFDTIDPSTTSGNQLAQILNDFKDAVMSGFIGASRPSQIEAGGFWIDNSLQGTLNVWDFKIYNGTTDVAIFRINLATGTPSITGSENTFEVTRISADSVGPLFKLIKERVANNGQTLFGDTLGEIQFLGAADDLTNPVSVKIKAVATDTFTGSEQGAALVFELVNTDSNLISEVMRIVDGKLGLGLVNPSEKLTVSGNIKGQRVLDDANPAKSILKKGRVSGGGQVLNNDYIGQQTFISTDETGSEIEVAKIEVKATQDHFGSQQGSALSISTKNNNSAVYTEKLKIDSSGVTIDGTLFNSTNVQLKSEKGAANGYAPLDATSKIDTIYLPSYVDDVVEYANLAAFPVTGESGKIYVAIDTGKTYRWSGSAYVEISPSDVNSVAGKTGIVTLDKNDVGLSNVDNTSDATKNSAVATLTNKTIQGANIQDPTRLDVKKDTYANLVTYATTATNGQLCFATDTKAMYQVVDNVLTEVGGSGSGVGEKNFIANFNFETNLNGWATYKDADQATPENGTGGTPNVTISRSTTSPISGGASLLFSKAGTASRRGEGFSYDFTIDNEAKAKVITIRFDYQIVSGTYADNDITFWIYDVTNGTLIQPTAFQLKNTGIIDRVTMEFQSNFSSTSYRLIAHIASTTTQDFVLRFDNIFVGRGSKSYGSVATDWELVTSGASVNWTNSTLTLYKRRVGDSVEYQGKIDFTGTPSGSGLRITLPHHYQSKSLNSGFNNNLGYILDASASQDYTLFGGTTASNEFSIYRVTNSPPIMGSYSSVTPTAPITVATGDYISFKIDAMPVQGWSSSQQLSQDADTRVVALTVNGINSTTYTASTNLIFNTIERDTHGAYNASTGVYTVPVSGFYRISLNTPQTASGAPILYVAKNNAFLNGTLPSSRILIVSTTNYGSGSRTAYFESGDTISIKPDSGTSGAWVSTSYFSYSIERISGPSQIAASETVSVRYTQSSGQIIPNDTPTIVNFSTRTWDSHNAVTIGASWRFTAPISGEYEISSNIQYASTSWGAGKYATLGVRKNGVNYAYAPDRVTQATQSMYYSPFPITTKIKLLVGEYVDIATQHNRGGDVTMYAFNSANWVEINRIGNY